MCRRSFDLQLYPWRAAGEGGQGGLEMSEQPLLTCCSSLHFTLDEWVYQTL